VLRDLHVRNLAVLAGGAVEFGPGLNVLTGETGAGKSIVVDSLGLLAGARASADLIRSGADALTVTGVFLPAGARWRELLAAAGIAAEGDELVVRREIGREGRNRVFVNDQPATLRLLAELAPELLRIHGQRDELSLVEPELQRDWLDAHGGAEAAALRERTATAFAGYAGLRLRLERAAGDERARRERLDLLRFQAAAIDAVRPRAGEEDELRAERDVLRNVEAISAALGGAAALLLEDEDAAAGRLARSRHLLDEIGAWEPQAQAWASEAEELRIRVEELADSLRRRLDRVEADPRRLDAVEDRLAALERLLQRYAPSSAELLELRARIGREIDELEADAADREGLEGKVQAALAEYRRAADALSAKRRAWGEELARRVQEELRELALGRARFAVALERRTRAGSPLLVDGTAVDFGPCGYDQVVFELAPNPGEPAKPLQRAASGGELSRVYLALQLAVARSGDPASGDPGAGGPLPTLVFDEVDAGLGGAEAAALGRKLQRLARGGRRRGAQILAVTHLAQVASFADLQFKVSKRVEEGRTYASVEALDRAARVEEVARMLAGHKVTALSLSHAEELIAGAEHGR